MSKVRLDVLLVERGLAESRAKAQALIMAGQVRVADQVALKPATAVAADSVLTVDSGPRFVSRGGEKLDAALKAFEIDVTGLTCADVGASQALDVETELLRELCTFAKAQAAPTCHQYRVGRPISVGRKHGTGHRARVTLGWDNPSVRNFAPPETDARLRRC